jgi:acyl carrier protein
VLTEWTKDQIEATVHGRIAAVIVEREGEAPPLAASDKLSATLGLTSLDLALIVSELEAELGVDPFAERVAITSVRTVGDLIRVYHEALSSNGPAAVPSDELSAASQRGLQRLARRGRK